MPLREVFWSAHKFKENETRKLPDAVRGEHWLDVGLLIQERHSAHSFRLLGDRIALRFEIFDDSVGNFFNICIEFLVDHATYVARQCDISRIEATNS